MKIRFDSRKEARPTEDGGLAVLYAPGKRIAYRLRWYLILLLAASPLIWFAGWMLRGVWLVEAPAVLRLESTELRAGETGRVMTLAVMPGERVSAGQALVSLENPELEARMARLEVGAGERASPLDPALIEQERRLLNARLARSVAWANQVDALRRQGAATESERLAALAARDQLHRDTLAFEQQVRTLQLTRDDMLQQERAAEHAWLQTRRERLSISAAHDGTILDVLIKPGETVGPGTLLMRLENGDAPRLWIYLDPRETPLARPGQAIRVRMPDGHWRDAHVLGTADSAAHLPGDLRNGLGTQARGVLVSAAFDTALPDHWRIDQLPLQVRFPSPWEASAPVVEARRLLASVSATVASLNK